MLSWVFMMCPTERVKKHVDTKIPPGGSSRSMYAKAGEICFAPSYRTQIGAHGVRGRASQFDDSTDKLKMILLRSKMIGRLGRFDSGTSSDNNTVE